MNTSVRLIMNFVLTIMSFFAMIVCCDKFIETFVLGIFESTKYLTVNSIYAGAFVIFFGIALWNITSIYIEGRDKY